MLILKWSTKCKIISLAESRPPMTVCGLWRVPSTHVRNHIIGHASVWRSCCTVRSTWKCTLAFGLSWESLERWSIWVIPRFFSAASEKGFSHITFVIVGSIAVPRELVGDSNWNALLVQMAMVQKSTQALPAEQLHRVTEVQTKSSCPRRLKCDSTKVKIKRTRAKKMKQVNDILGKVVCPWWCLMHASRVVCVPMPHVMGHVCTYVYPRFASRVLVPREQPRNFGVRFGLS